MIQGVDISRFQPDYQPRPEDHFVLVKASEGRTVLNPHHDDQIARCRAAGQIVGHYHWLHPGNVAAQVDWFEAQADVKPGDLIACDWENPDPTVPVQDVVAWLQLAKARFPRNRVVVYSYPFYGPFKTDGRTAVAASDGLWIADYRTNAPRDIHGLPYVIHQYTDEPFDHNRANFDTVAEMRAWTLKETDMALTEEDKQWIRDAIYDQLILLLPKIWDSAEVDMIPDGGDKIRPVTALKRLLEAR